eukprot:gene1023-7728_t
MLEVQLRRYSLARYRKAFIEQGISIDSVQMQDLTRLGIRGVDDCKRFYALVNSVKEKAEASMFGASRGRQTSAPAVSRQRGRQLYRNASAGATATGLPGPASSSHRPKPPRSAPALLPSITRPTPTPTLPATLILTPHAVQQQQQQQQRQQQRPGSSSSRRPPKTTSSRSVRSARSARQYLALLNDDPGGGNPSRPSRNGTSRGGEDDEGVGGRTLPRASSRDAFYRSGSRAGARTVPATEYSLPNSDPDHLFLQENDARLGYSWSAELQEEGTFVSMLSRDEPTLYGTEGESDASVDESLASTNGADADSDNGGGGGGEDEDEGEIEGEIEFVMNTTNTFSNDEDNSDSLEFVDDDSDEELAAEASEARLAAVAAVAARIVQSTSATKRPPKSVDDSAHAEIQQKDGSRTRPVTQGDAFAAAQPSSPTTAAGGDNILSGAIIEPASPSGSRPTVNTSALHASKMKGGTDNNPYMNSSSSSSKRKGSAEPRHGSSKVEIQDPTRTRPVTRESMQKDGATAGANAGSAATEYSRPASAGVKAGLNPSLNPDPAPDPEQDNVKIRVCVRKRPLGKREKRKNDADVVDVTNSTTCCINANKVAVDMTTFNQRHKFVFDEVFSEARLNEQVYQRSAAPLVRKVVNDGCMATCFAYGQTGSGKTHTMMGIPGKIDGLYLLGARDLFDRMATTDMGGKIQVMASFYEIYCGKLYDLLNGRQELHAREDGHGKIHIRGIERVEVLEPNDIMTAIEKGNRARITGQTGANDTSSRSHAVVQLELMGPNKGKGGPKLCGRLSFIDLAGSERASDTQDNDKRRRMEGAEINTSLLALKECIRGLDADAVHIPFRQSKLTMVLKDSFVGNSRTCMIACIAPGFSSCEHTLNTLRYADRVKELSGSSNGGSTVLSDRRQPYAARPGTKKKKSVSKSKPKKQSKSKSTPNPKPKPRPQWNGSIVDYAQETSPKERSSRPQWDNGVDGHELELEQNTKPSSRRRQEANANFDAVDAHVRNVSRPRSCSQQNERRERPQSRGSGSATKSRSRPVSARKSSRKGLPPDWNTNPGNSNGRRTPKHRNTPLGIDPDDFLQATTAAAALRPRSGKRVLPRPPSGSKHPRPPSRPPVAPSKSRKEAALVKAKPKRRKPRPRPEWNFGDGGDDAGAGGDGPLVVWPGGEPAATHTEVPTSSDNRGQSPGHRRPSSVSSQPRSSRATSLQHNHHQPAPAHDGYGSQISEVRAGSGSHGQAGNPAAANYDYERNVDSGYTRSDDAQDRQYHHAGSSSNFFRQDPPLNPPPPPPQKVDNDAQIADDALEDALTTPRVANTPGSSRSNRKRWNRPESFTSSPPLAAMSGLDTSLLQEMNSPAAKIDYSAVRGEPIEFLENSRQSPQTFAVEEAFPLQSAVVTPADFLNTSFDAASKGSRHRPASSSGWRTVTLSRPSSARSQRNDGSAQLFASPAAVQAAHAAAALVATLSPQAQVPTPRQQQQQQQQQEEVQYTDGPNGPRRMTRVERARQEALAAFGGLSFDDVSNKPQVKAKPVMTMKDWESAGMRSNSNSNRLTRLDKHPRFPSATQNISAMPKGDGSHFKPGLPRLTLESFGDGAVPPVAATLVNSDDSNQKEVFYRVDDAIRFLGRPSMSSFYRHIRNGKSLDAGDFKKEIDYKLLVELFWPGTSKHRSTKARVIPKWVYDDKEEAVGGLSIE